MNSDLIELLRYLKKHRAKYLVIGGQAVVAYAEPRYTKDLDLWIEPSVTNARNVLKALIEFGAPSAAVAEEDLARPGTIFIFGVEPNRVDILNKVKGAKFSRAYKNRELFKIDGLQVAFVSRADLIRIKQATGRPQDLLDVANLKKIQDRRSRKK